MKTLGEKIKFLRKDYGLSQNELADKIHVSRYVISKWENDKSEPDITSLKELSKCFQISIDELVNNDVLPSSLPPTVPQNPAHSKYDDFFVPLILLVCLVSCHSLPFIGVGIAVTAMIYFYKHRTITFHKLFLIISIGFFLFHTSNSYAQISYQYNVRHPEVTIEKID